MYVKKEVCSGMCVGPGPPKKGALPYTILLGSSRLTAKPWRLAESGQERGDRNRQDEERVAAQKTDPRSGSEHQNQGGRNEHRQEPERAEHDEEPGFRRDTVCAPVRGSDRARDRVKMKRRERRAERYRLRR